MANTLDLDDADDLFDEVEDTFGIRIELDDESATLGDLHRQLVTYFHGKGGGRCATAMAFFRLRAQLRGPAMPKPVPSSPLAPLAGKDAAGWLIALKHRTDLDMPPLAEAGPVGSVGCLIIIACLVVGAGLLYFGFGFAFLWSLCAIVPGLVLGVTMIRMGSSTLSKDCATLGALAGQVAALNFAKLVGQGAHAGPREIWTVLVGLAAAESDTPRDQITPETLLVTPDADDD